MLPDKPRGVRRVDDWRILNRIFWALRSGAPWCGLRDFGPYTTLRQSSSIYFPANFDRM
jgi:transposase